MVLPESVVEWDVVDFFGDQLELIFLDPFDLFLRTGTRLFVVKQTFRRKEILLLDAVVLQRNALIHHKFLSFIRLRFQIKIRRGLITQKLIRPELPH